MARAAGRGQRAGAQTLQAASPGAAATQCGAGGAGWGCGMARPAAHAGGRAAVTAQAGKQGATSKTHWDSPPGTAAYCLTRFLRASGVLFLLPCWLFPMTCSFNVVAISASKLLQSCIVPIFAYSSCSHNPHTQARVPWPSLALPYSLPPPGRLPGSTAGHGAKCNLFLECVHSPLRSAVPSITCVQKPDQHVQ